MFTQLAKNFLKFFLRIMDVLSAQCTKKIFKAFPFMESVIYKQKFSKLSLFTQIHEKDIRWWCDFAYTIPSLALFFDCLFQVLASSYRLNM